MRVRSAERKAGREGAIFEYHAMAGDPSSHAWALMHGKTYIASLTGFTDHAGNLSVCCDPALGNLSDKSKDALKETIHCYSVLLVTVSLNLSAFEKEKEMSIVTCSFYAQMIRY